MVAPANWLRPHARIARWYLARYSEPTARAHMAEGLRKAGILRDED